MSYDPSEQDELAGIFARLLRECTKDGGVKRAAGEKVSWKVDGTHEAALFSHLNKWKHGELKDDSSGAHPLVHLAWRALAIAWQETRDAELPEREPTYEYMEEVYMGKGIHHRKTMADVREEWLEQGPSDYQATQRRKEEMWRKLSGPSHPPN